MKTYIWLMDVIVLALIILCQNEKCYQQGRVIFALRLVLVVQFVL